MMESYSNAIADLRGDLHAIGLTAILSDFLSANMSLRQSADSFLDRHAADLRQLEDLTCSAARVQSPEASKFISTAVTDLRPQASGGWDLESIALLLSVYAHDPSFSLQIESSNRSQAISRLRPLCATIAEKLALDVLFVRYENGRLGTGSEQANLLELLDGVLSKAWMLFPPGTFAQMPRDVAASILQGFTSC